MMCSQAVLKYLESTNRPYSANDIVQNLHNAYSKGAIQKALDELAEKGSIREKVYGKQKVYVIVQQQTDDVQNDDELAELDKLIAEANEEYKKLETQLKAAEAKLKEMSSLPTTKEAELENEMLKTENEALREKLNNLKSGTILISKQDQEKIKKLHEEVSRNSRKRKRWMTNLLDAVLENYPKKKADLIEEIGLEM